MTPPVFHRPVNNVINRESTCDTGKFASSVSANVGRVCDNESAPGGAGNTTRGLTATPSEQTGGDGL